MKALEIIVIGGGPSGIALAHTLKHKLGFHDFTVRRFDCCFACRFACRFDSS